MVEGTRLEIERPPLKRFVGSNPTPSAILKCDTAICSHCRRLGLREKLWQHLRIPAHKKIPYPQPTPVIDRRYPTACSLVLCTVLVIFIALHLKNRSLPALHVQDVVRLKMMLDASVLVGDQKKRTIIADVAEDVYWGRV